LLAFQRHPINSKRPIIDYDVSLVTQPIILSGTILGVLFNIMFPNYLIIILLIALLAVTTFRTIKNGIKTYRAEKLEQQKQIEQQRDNEERNEPHLRLEEGDERIVSTDQIGDDEEELKDVDISSPVNSGIIETPSEQDINVEDQLDSNRKDRILYIFYVQSDRY
jgi:hypothetical protein